MRFIIVEIFKQNLNKNSIILQLLSKTLLIHTVIRFQVYSILLNVFYHLIILKLSSLFLKQRISNKAIPSKNK